MSQTKRIASRKTSVNEVTIGVDLGGTKTMFALVNSEGHILSSHRQRTNPEIGPEGVLADLAAGIREHLVNGNGGVTKVAISVAGQVSPEGVVLMGPNLGWQDVPLRAKLERELKIPAVVLNDVRAAMIGEWLYGSGKDIDNLVVLFVGTGVGGGAICSGQVLEGCTNSGGELGHITVVVDGRKCHCPNKGCLEAYVGGWAIAERARDAVRADRDSGRRLLDLSGSLDTITADAVTRAYREGDRFACQLIQQTALYLAAGVVSLVNAFNPCLFVLGGGLCEGVPDLIQIVEAQVRRNALGAALQKLRFSNAILGEYAGVIGASAFARGVVP